MSMIGANYVNLCHHMLFYYLMIKVKVFIEEIQHPATGVSIIYHIINSTRHANSNLLNNRKKSRHSSCLFEEVKYLEYYLAIIVNL